MAVGACRAFLFEPGRRRDASGVARPGSHSPRSQHQGTSLSGPLLSRDRSPTSFKGPSGGREVYPSGTNQFPWAGILVWKLHQATRSSPQHLEERGTSLCSAAFALPCSGRKVNRARQEIIRTAGKGQAVNLFAHLRIWMETRPDAQLGPDVCRSRIRVTRVHEYTALELRQLAESFTSCYGSERSQRFPDLDA
jgi:hypothetical protein